MIELYTIKNVIIIVLLHAACQITLAPRCFALVINLLHVSMFFPTSLPEVIWHTPTSNALMFGTESTDNLLFCWKMCLGKPNWFLFKIFLTFVTNERINNLIIKTHHSTLRDKLILRLLLRFLQAQD